MLIYVSVPLLGLTAFMVLRQRLLNAGAAPFVVAAWFILFATYGGALLVVLTQLFWRWSGAASLGGAYLLLVAPLLLLVLGWALWRRRALAGYDNAPYVLCFAYPLLAGGFAIWVATSGIP